MTADKSKYSLWIRPKGEAAAQLQSLINDLAKKYGAPVFEPHITLVGHIKADAKEITEAKRKIDELAGKLEPFTVTLTEYGFMDEEHRCLYLLAESPRLAVAYEQAATLFPQVEHEHFRQMPHLSLLYGQYAPEVKREIIKTNPLPPITFEVESLDMHLTDGLPSAWQATYSARLGI